MAAADARSDDRKAAAGAGKATPELQSSPTVLSSRPASTSAGALPSSIGPFQIVRRLGKGGMGTVYLAYEPLVHRTVALKVLQGDEGRQELYAKAARFLAEAMLTGRLTHAGIIPVYYVGYDPAHGYFYSMRFVKGRTLQDIMRERQRHQWGDAEEYSLTRLLEVVLRVCEAVAFAHRAGVLHRDLKPANIMITESSEVLVVDWGLAKDLRTHDPLAEVADSPAETDRAEPLRRLHQQATRSFLAQARPPEQPPGSTGLYQAVMDGEGEEQDTAALLNLTQDGLLVGTPFYMSPEQIRGERTLTPASDVYALGVILYRLLTGTMPVECKDITDLIERVSAGNIEPIETRPQALRLPRALCTIVNRCLAFDLAQRYADAGELAEELRLYLEGRTSLAPLLHADFVTRAPDAPPLTDEWDVTGAPVQTHEGLELTAGTLLRTRQRSLGDFRCTVGFRGRSAPWCLSVQVGTIGEDRSFAVRHEVRIGLTDRPYVELLWLRRRMQRRFDIRLQTGQYYQLALELEEEHLRVRLDGVLVLNYREAFPQAGGVLAFRAREGVLVLQDIDWRSRGAPLHLSYQFLPDRLFLAGRFAEARQLYLQMAESHPDREEGLTGVYKAGLCSAELKENQAAFDSFSRLENTMLDHYCTIGLARIGLLDGNLEWAWEALKSGYLRHKHPDVRTEMWFALLDVLEQFGKEDTGGKAKRYLELLHDLEPMPQEARQITYEYFDMVMRRGGVDALRGEAAALLERHAGNPSVAGEALQALWRTGLDDGSAALAQHALDRLFAERSPEASDVRLLLMKAEAELGVGQVTRAMETLSTAAGLSAGFRSEQLWARNWLLFARYLGGEYERTLQEGREMLQLMDQYSAGHLAYLLFLVALVQSRQGRVELARDALGRAKSCAGWWGMVAGYVLAGALPRDAVGRQPNPNLATEALLMVGEMHLCMGNAPLGREYLKACMEHPCRRRMTRFLAAARLRGAAAAGEGRPAS